MISAVQEQERQRQRTRSAASGPAFSVPEMPELGPLSSVSFPSEPACTAAPSASAVSTPAASLDLTGFLGRSVGSGQCVALVRAATGIGSTAGWSPGASVQGNAGIAPGTPIATFDAGDRYANALDGTSHAAIYLGQNASGVTVLDQWAGSTAAVRTIPWSNPGAAPANTGAAFRVIRQG